MPGWRHKELQNAANTGTVSATGANSKFGDIHGETRGVVTITNAENVGQITSDPQTGFSGSIIGLTDKANSRYVYNYGGIISTKQWQSDQAKYKDDASF